MNGEQIFLGGVPTVGFGNADTALANPKKPLIGLLVGTTAGALLGALTKKSVWTITGAVVGGLGGAVAGTAMGLRDAGIVASTPPPWHRLQENDTVKSGQQVAITIAGPNRAPLTPDDMAQVASAVALIPAYNVTKVVAQYPPNSSLPFDWPADDDLGPGAYRVIIEALVAAAPTFSKLFEQHPDAVTVEGWVRDKQ